MTHPFMTLVAGVFTLFLTGCIMPKQFEAKLDIEKNGDYAFSYDGTIVHLAMLMDQERGKLDERGEQQVAKDILAEFKNDENTVDVSYLGGSAFKIVYRIADNINTRPLEVGMKGMELFTLEKSPDGSQATFSFLPGFDKEKMMAQYPASGLAPKGSIELTTELPVKSGVGDPAENKNGDATAYIWLVDGIKKDLPKLVLGLK